MKSSIIFISLLVSGFMYAQEIENNTQIPPPPCYANGNSGFTGAVGEGHFLKSDPNSIVWLSFFTGNGDPNEVNEINDILVLYIDTGAPGRNVIGYNIDDNADAHRIAISNSNSSGFASVITFPPGFEASYAVAINVGFGGLWSIPTAGNVGANQLNFITSVNSTLLSPQQEHFVISFDWDDIGLTETDEFYFVGVYVSNSGYTSDEGYGEGITVGTEGSDNIAFTGYLSFPSCSVILNDTDNLIDDITANYFNKQLIVKGINELITISVYDILGRELYREKHQVQESEIIPLDLNKNELQFIVIESSNKKKVFKVIPN